MVAPVCLIVNPAAGGGRAGRLAPHAELALREQGLTVRRVHTRDLQHARELATNAAHAGETIVSLSGDGLLGAIADAVRDMPHTVLGLIPGGRGNDLARVLGIPDDVRAAARIVAEGHARPLDLGLVESASPGGDDASTGSGASAGRAFVGIASVGFDSDANRIANEAPAWLGRLVYVYGALRALAAWRPARFTLELDPPSASPPHRHGERHEWLVYSLGACNSRAYGGGMYAAPDALLDDGQLDVVVVQDMSKLVFLTRILPKVFSGAHVREPGVRSFRAHEITLSADRPFIVYADGDPIAELPVRVRALPAALTMIMPAQPGPAFSSR